MIKPSDVPTDLAEFACSFSDIAPRQGRYMVAAILQAAIDAGLVVPASEAKVLRRVLRDVAEDMIWTDDIGIDDTVEEWIDLARRNIESEESDA